jgi:hypothetical protein
MAQAERNSSTSLSRRSAIALGAGALISTGAPAAVASAAPVDPIFKAIADHQLAEDQLEKALESLPRDFDFYKPDDHRAYRRLKRPVDRACIALIGTVPTTAGGVSALLWYIWGNQQGDLSFSCEPILRVIKRRASAAFSQAGLV